MISNLLVQGVYLVTAKQGVRMAKIYVHGDTHGGYHANYIKTAHFQDQKQHSKNDLLVILGDFGYIWCDEGTAFYEQQQSNISQLANRNFQTCFLDGNHENFDLLEKLPQAQIWGGKVGVVNVKGSTNKIYHLKRGEIYEINGKKILAVGGAVSIDKVHRTPHVSWWVQESINQSEMDNTIANLNKHSWCVDLVFTHTCPSRIIPKMIREKPLDDPNSLFFDTLIDQGLKFEQWHFGHFHENKAIDTQFRCHFNQKPHLIQS